MAKPPVRDQLAALGEGIRDEFATNRRVLSFAEYLELCATAPERQLRSAPQYLVDCMHHYGSSEVEYPWGRIRRFNLFDVPWANGEGRLIGQEPVQNQVYRILQNFVQDGSPNRMILLHGPNGSAKTTLISCLGRALEDYSTLDQGALYRFNWIFPAQKSTRAGIGFGGKDGADPADTFAYLPDELIDARLTDELRDHPLLLVPLHKRTEMIKGFLSTSAPSFVQRLLASRRAVAAQPRDLRGAARELSGRLPEGAAATCRSSASTSRIVSHRVRDGRAAAQRGCIRAADHRR